mmetsp:Transcript_124757/g.353165  ORF Transcript_124757/g.353165 Transcript_124757/m.353165 type:complete len:80 (-) Transcript_124757:1797-2036(-)
MVTDVVVAELMLVLVNVPLVSVIVVVVCVVLDIVVEVMVPVIEVVDSVSVLVITGQAGNSPCVWKSPSVPHTTSADSPS